MIGNSDANALQLFPTLGGESKSLFPVSFDSILPRHSPCPDRLQYLSSESGVCNSERRVMLSGPLNVLLVFQARDDILNGSHPVSFEKACEFGGFQAQIQFGPHVEHKHKPGFLE